MFESTIPVDMRNTMKAEAVKCMGILKLDKRCIKAFENGSVWLSSEPFGGLYEADDKLKNMIMTLRLSMISLSIMLQKMWCMVCTAILCCVSASTRKSTR